MVKVLEMSTWRTLRIWNYLQVWKRTEDVICFVNLTNSPSIWNISETFMLAELLRNLEKGYLDSRAIEKFWHLGSEGGRSGAKLTQRRRPVMVVPSPDEGKQKLLWLLLLLLLLLLLSGVDYQDWEEFQGLVSRAGGESQWGNHQATSQTSCNTKVLSTGSLGPSWLLASSLPPFVLPTFSGVCVC